MTVLRVRYNDLVDSPRAQAERVREFLGGRADVERMVQAVAPALYRNRKAAGSPSWAARPDT
jgi:hypothetical protein